jgi:hypothetical protein
MARHWETEIVRVIQPQTRGQGEMAPVPNWVELVMILTTTSLEVMVVE